MHPPKISDPVRESIQEIDKNTWLIGRTSILRRDPGHSETACWYDEPDDLSYTLTQAPDPLPQCVALPADHPSILLVYDAGDCSAVWSIGNSAFCKVKLRVDGATHEATTLEFVRQKHPDFEIPVVLHQMHYRDRSCLFLRRVPGRTLTDAWQTLDQKWKSHYVQAIVKVCETLATWKGNEIAGVDGKTVKEPYLTKYKADEDFSPENLQRSCQACGMDCSDIVFAHVDLGPGNIIVEDTPRTGSVGIIDWECAGYFPRKWIRTKFRLSSGLDLPKADSVTEGQEWRRQVQIALGAHGFEDCAEQWQSWWY